MLTKAWKKYQNSFSSYTLIATVLFLSDIILICVAVFNFFDFKTSGIYMLFPDTDEWENLVRTLTTIGATLAGFSYTTLGVMVSFLSNKTVQNDQSDGYLDKYFLSAYSSLIIFSIAIIVGLTGIIMSTSCLEIWILFILLVLIANGVVAFIFTLWQFIHLVQYIRSISQE